MGAGRSRTVSSNYTKLTRADIDFMIESVKGFLDKDATKEELLKEAEDYYGKNFQDVSVSPSEYNNIILPVISRLTFKGSNKSIDEKTVKSLERKGVRVLVDPSVSEGQGGYSVNYKNGITLSDRYFNENYRNALYNKLEEYENDYRYSLKPSGNKSHYRTSVNNSLRVLDELVSVYPKHHTMDHISYSVGGDFSQFNKINKNFAAYFYGFETKKESKKYGHSGGILVKQSTFTRDRLRDRDHFGDFYPFGSNRSLPNNLALVTIHEFAHSVDYQHRRNEGRHWSLSKKIYRRSNRRGVTDYANKNGEEAFAECFVFYTLGLKPPKRAENYYKTFCAIMKEEGLDKYKGCLVKKK